MYMRHSDIWDALSTPASYPYGLNPCDLVRRTSDVESADRVDFLP